MDTSKGAGFNRGLMFVTSSLGCGRLWAGSGLDAIGIGDALEGLYDPEGGLAAAGVLASG